MTDEPDTPDNTDESDDGSAQSALASFNPPPQAPLKGEEPPEESDDSESKRGPAKWTDYVMTWATGVMALATIGIGILAYFQWRDSGKLNDAATKAAAAADKFQGSAAHLETIIGTAQGDMQTMADSSKKSIQATQNSIRLDQRAWVVLRGIEGIPQLDQPWSLKVYFINTGKTPARNVRLSCNAEPANSEANASFHETPYERRTLYPPNDPGPYCELFPINTPTVTQPVLNVFANKTVTILVYGSLIYDDVFKAHHWMTFCRVMQPDGKAWNSCQTHTDDTGDGEYTQK
jgi:hypothetical protein